MERDALVDLQIDLSGIPLRIRGADPDLAERFRDKWGEYLASPGGAPLIDLTLCTAGPSVAGGPFNPKTMTGEFEAGTARFTFEEGALQLDADGVGAARLSPSPSPHRRFCSLVNLICAGLALHLPRRRAMLLHGAAVVLEGHGFLMLGPEGAGKSTWSGLAKSAGARLLSDDMVVVQDSGERIEVLSLPIREDLDSPVGPGRWPLAALLLSAHGRPARLEPVSGIRLHAALAAGCLFVGETLESNDPLAEMMQRVAGRVAAYTLTFPPDTSFVPALLDLLP